MTVDDHLAALALVELVARLDDPAAMPARHEELDALLDGVDVEKVALQLAGVRAWRGRLHVGGGLALAGCLCRSIGKPDHVRRVDFPAWPAGSRPGVTATDAGLVMRTRAAKILTEVFAPPILVLTLLLVVGIHSTSSVTRGLLLGAVATFFAAGLPYAIMLVGIRRGRLSDRHLSLRAQRPVMMVIGLGSVSVGLLVMVWLDAPRELFALVAAMVAGIGVALAISSFWKISIHAACAAGTVAILVIVFGWIMLAWVPVVAAICWARVTLRDHTPLQVVAGSAVGAIVAAAVMVPLA